MDLPPASPFAPYDRVQIVGLESRPDLNGVVRASFLLSSIAQATSTGLRSTLGGPSAPSVCRIEAAMCASSRMSSSLYVWVCIYM